MPLMRSARLKRDNLSLLTGGAALIRAVAAVERAAQARHARTHASGDHGQRSAARRWSRALCSDDTGAHDVALHTTPWGFMAVSLRGGGRSER